MTAPLIQKTEDKSNLTPEDFLIQYLIRQINQAELIESQLKLYASARDLSGEERTGAYILTYGELEKFILTHQPPVVTQVFTKEELHTALRKELPIADLNSYLRILVLPKKEALIGLYNIVSSSLFQYIIDNLGEKRLLASVKIAVKDTVLETVKFDDKTFISNQLLQESPAAITTAFFKLNTVLCDDILNIFGEKQIDKICHTAQQFITSYYSHVAPEFISDIDAVTPAKRKRKKVIEVTESAREMLKKLGMATLVSEGVVRDIRAELLDVNSISVPVTANASALKDEQGNISGMIISVRDISEIQKLQQEKLSVLEQSKVELEERVKERTSSLEEGKRAMLNILEDINLEKDRSDRLAEDLQKFQLAIESTSEQVVITDPDGTVVYANPATERITGFSVAEILGTKIGSLWGDFTKLSFYESLWKTVTFDKKQFFGETSSTRKDGSVYDTHITASPVLNEANEIIFFVLLERDITEEKKIDQAKTEFVSLASHQLRTPLSTINWYTEMLLDGDVGKLNKEQNQYLEEIYTGNQRMVDLVNSLLDVSRIELGTFTIEPEEIDLCVIASNAIKELQHVIKEKKLKFKDSYKDIPLLNLDPKLTHMIFQNLLSNAVKYTPEKGTVTLTITRKETEVLITVNDTGYGIPENQQGKIFLKLFRADNVRQKDTQGTGLGLYLVKAIVEISGGSIRFESKENKGTTFFVTLPIVAVEINNKTKEAVAPDD